MRVWIVLSKHASKETWIDSVHSSQEAAWRKSNDLNDTSTWVDSWYEEYEVTT